MLPAECVRAKPGGGALRPMRSRRSCLSVPGSSAKMLGKAPGLGADELVLDLEDAVAPERKDEARALVIAALREQAGADGRPAVRINGTASRHCHRDVVALAGTGGDALGSLVLPKAESAGDVAFVDRLLGMVEAETGRARPIGLQVLIETATGLRRIHEIAHASPRVEALIVGYADLGASLGIDASAPYPGDRWHWVRETALVAARDAGVQAIDGPYLELDDLAGLEASATHAQALGFDGKWAIHPAQIEPLNRIFSPSPEALAQARATLAALERAELEGTGAVALDGVMIDEASAKLARQIVARGDAAGAA